MSGFAPAQDHQALSKVITEGNSNTALGKFRIELNNQSVLINGEQVRSYKITYDNSPVSVIVLVDKDKKCKNYIVVSEDLSLMYKCNGEYFGVKRIDEKYRKDGYFTDNNNLDQANYFHQKVLALGKQNEVNATTLIACYFPELIKK